MKRKISGSRPLILLDKRFPPKQQAFLEHHVDVVMLSSDPPSEVRAKVEGIVWYGHGVVDGTLLDQYPNLKVVSNFGVGYEFIDCEAAVSRGLPVGHTPGCLSDSVADLTMGLLIASARGIVEGAVQAAAPDFQHINPNDLGKQVSGATIGIVGMGAIGLEIARRAAAFRMPVLYHNRSRRSESDEKSAGHATFCSSLEDLLRKADFVVLACPATPATRHLMSKTQFEAMKDDAVLVNIARGSVVDQDALVAALTKNELALAALDVTEPEPLPRDHPLVNTAGTPLQGKVLITPHQGSATAETRMDMMKMCLDNLNAGLSKGVRLPWTVAEVEKLFPAGSPVGPTHVSGRKARL